MRRGGRKRNLYRIVPLRIDAFQIRSTFSSEKGARSPLIHRPRTLPAMTRVLFVFLDGVGLGPSAATNPLATTALPAFAALAGGHAWTADAPAHYAPDHVFQPIDATLGVEGLPQSGTGQATLFTGVNCAAVVGRHFGPFPHSATHPILARENLFRKVQQANEPATAAFANAYPPRFFELARQRRRWTVTTRCCVEADVPIRGLDALREGRALTADLTGHGWAPLGHDVPPISEAEAGRRLAALARAHTLTLYEYFLTDKAGHGRLDRPAADVLGALDRFFAALLDALDPTEELLLVTSDHGNLEDVARKTHTRHPVPLIAYGRGAEHFADAESIADVTPCLVALLDGTR